LRSPLRARIKRPGATEFYSREVFRQPLVIAILLRRKAKVPITEKLKKIDAESRWRAFIRFVSRAVQLGFE
jgi:hypothetical protein